MKEVVSMLVPLSAVSVPGLPTHKVVTIYPWDIFICGSYNTSEIDVYLETKSLSFYYAFKASNDKLDSHIALEIQYLSRYHSN
jgi:hypothetical protein